MKTPSPLRITVILIINTLPDVVRPPNFCGIPRVLDPSGQCHSASLQSAKNPFLLLKSSYKGKKIKNLI